MNEIETLAKEVQEVGQFLKKELDEVKKRVDNSGLPQEQKDVLYESMKLTAESMANPEGGLQHIKEAFQKLNDTNTKS